MSEEEEKKAPISVAITKLLGRTGGAILDDIILTFVADYIRGAGITFRTGIAIASDWLKTITADALDSLIEEESHPNTALSAGGLTNIFERFLGTVAKASMVLSADIAEELYTEMLQEGFSNAIQVSIGGALQSILSTWRGGYPLSYDQTPLPIESVEDLDSDTLALLLAQAGCNLPTIAFHIKQGFDRYIDSQLIYLRTQLYEITSRLNEIIAWRIERSSEFSIRQYYEGLEVLREGYSKAINLIDLICERALSRLQELLNEVKTGKAWLDYSLEHPEAPIVTEEEVNLLALENKMEAEEIINAVNSIISKIDDKLSAFDIDISTITSKIDTNILEEVNHLNSIIQQGIIDISTLISKIDEAMDKVVAYRHARELQTEPVTDLTRPVEVEGYQPPTPATYTVTVEVKG
ncbi:MAG: hypothetical protein DRJ38_07860 [Thermoprotei archaeon]|nr:MAG: hypothetical protein DRJ38_07860 [Thermoprotei archaeon]